MIHVWYICLHLVDFDGFHVGKYTVRPMDPSWDSVQKACFFSQHLDCGLGTFQHGDDRIFCLGINHSSGAWGGWTKTWDNSHLEIQEGTTFMAWSQAQKWSYSGQISKIGWFQSCFGLIFIPGRWCEKSHELGGLVNGGILCLLRWGECHFSTGNTDDRATATGWGQMEGLMEGLRLVHWANVKLYRIWYIVTYGREILYN